MGLIFWQLDAVVATDKLLNIIVQGVRVDLIQLGLMFLIPLLIFPLSFINGQTKNIYSALGRIEKHLDKLNGRVTSNEKDIARLQVWGGVALVTFPVIVNTIMRLV